MSKGTCAEKRHVGDHGYVLVWEPDHPLAHRNGYVYEHRKVVFDAGTLLHSGLAVHHINGVKTDNRLTNLRVMDRGEHSREHALAWGERRRAARVAWLDSPSSRRACERCGALFRIRYPSSLNRFCSRSCSVRGIPRGAAVKGRSRRR